MRRARKSSLRVSLVLVGVAALSGCGEDGERRDVYKSREDCLADWNNKPEDCTPATEPRHAASHYWYGPSYGGWTSRAHGSPAIGSSHSGVTRGGFGSSAHGTGG